ncbi:MAG: matrixin family metalloprotease [Bdellovibrionales bacterium]|jgi:hypothetical protein|nr:matrixin family metalloprotease [Bdellovibrionales bacterium]MBT3526877.1 matrixin family metalloprotease [Bdellovibrionales bacterium]MBT7669700.1 matrixin family metalloprotease [Bdellovibrionales bacterium]MBT7765786.1 matrixin family metalloprotease [Bdellovibrionales bacterium]
MAFTRQHCTPYKTLRNLILSAILTLPFFWNHVRAYTFTEDFQRGNFWASFPIPLSPFVATGEGQEQLQQILDEVEDEWENALGQEIWDIAPVVILDRLEGNTIRWSNDFGAETGYDPQQTLAITVRYSSSGLFTRTEIILNGSLTYLRDNQYQLLKKTILHEMGHTVGLDHSNHQAIMAAYISGVETLQEDDLEGIRAIFDQTGQRQASGISPLLKNEKNSLSSNMLGSCGTVTTNNNDGGGSSGSGGAAASFILSLLLGLLSTQLHRGKLCLLAQ